MFLAHDKAWTNGIKNFVFLIVIAIGISNMLIVTWIFTLQLFFILILNNFSYGWKSNIIQTFDFGIMEISIIFICMINIIFFVSEGDSSICSIHGLIRGENMELGRDSDTGGQVHMDMCFILVPLTVFWRSWSVRNMASFHFSVVLYIYASYFSRLCDLEPWTRNF